MKTVVTIRYAKAHLPELLQRVSRGEDVVIARGSKPVARLEAIADISGNRKPGDLKGRLKVGPEFFEELPEEELREW